MKKIVVLFVAAGALMVSTLGFAAEKAWQGNINFIAGTKSMDKDDTEPVNNQREAGVTFDIGKSALVSTFAFFGSSAEDTGSAWYYDYYAEANVEGTTREWRYGLKYIFSPTQELHPYVMAGALNVFGKAKLSASDNYGNYAWAESSGSGFGFWSGGGIYYTIGRHFNIGAEASYSAAQVEIFDENMEAGGIHANVFVGYHW